MDLQSLKNTGKSAFNAISKGDSKSFFEQYTKFIAIPDNNAFNGFSLDVTERRQLIFRTNFSDIPVPSGNIITQHSTREPALFELTGSIYEVFKKISSIDRISTQIENKVGIINTYIGEYTGKITQKITEAKNAINGTLTRIDQIVKDGNSVLSALNASNDDITTEMKNKIKILMNLYILQEPLTLNFFGILNEGLLFNNMYISELKIFDEPDIISGKINFNISFKQVFKVQNFYFSTIGQGELNSKLASSEAVSLNKGLINSETVSSKSVIKNVLGSLSF